MKTKLFLMSILFLAVFGCHAVVRAQQTSPQMTAANELFNAQKWAEAAVGYETVLKTEPNNGLAWYHLGMARYSLKQYAPASEAFLKNIHIADSPFSMFNLACVYSLLNDKEKALEWLSKSVNHPKMIIAAINFNDPDLANIRADERVKALAEKTERQIYPCKYSAEAKQFDFFIGEWDAFNPQGRKDGTSVIQSIADGCGVLENWTNGFGGSGKSINFYDKNAGKWFQYWIGQNGVPLRFAGIYKDGAIRYEGEPSMKNGKKVLSHLTFFNVDADTVRQLAEQSTDDGKTWQVGYDYKYVRRK